MIFAQVLNNIVMNVLVVPDGSTTDQYSVGFDSCVDVTSITPQPGVYWTYENSVFSHLILFDVTYTPGIPTGTGTTITPFTMVSNDFDVNVVDSVIGIGCQTYDYKWLRYVLYMFATGQSTQINCLIKVDGGLSFNNQFTIAQTDVDTTYEALCTLI